MNLLKGLNLEQKKAVTHQDGPLLIIAGAGTGKTKVITTRIAYLIEKGLAQPNEILALTFTDKAAREMEERVDLLLPVGMVDTYISTFHSFADKILREEAITFGLDPNFKILKKSEQVLFLADNLFKFKLNHLRPPTNPTKFIEILLKIISRAKDENVSPQEYVVWAKKSKNKIQLEIAKAYQTYQELLRKNNYMDFGDLIYNLLAGLKRRPEILHQLREKFKYILVDEFQDTNYIQNELVKILAAAKNNITVVADDDQSIYRFRGAAISNVINFKKDFPHVKQVVLTKNYRSTQPILDSAYRLIQNNNPDRLEVKNKINKKLQSATAKKGMVEFLSFDTESSEADKVVEIIKKKVSANGRSASGGESKKISYKDIAILVRANSYAQPFIRTLNLNGIPSQFSGDTLLYRRPEIQLLLNFLRSLTSNNDNLALFHLSTSSIYGMDINDLIELNDFCRRRNSSLYHLFSTINNLNLEISVETKEIASVIINDLQKYRELGKTKEPGIVLYQFLEEKKIIKEMSLMEETPENEIKIKNIANFFNNIKSFQDVVRAPTLMHLIEYLDSLLESGVNPEEKEIEADIEAVNILTAHSAKGLEFKIVFIASLIDGRFPATRRSESIDIPADFIKEVLPTGDWHIEEERRLFYVAMTRAKEELYLTSAASYGGERARRPSVFIAECLGKKIIAESKQKTIKKIKQIELFRESVEPKIRKSKVESLYLSHSQLDDYLTCPLKYKYSSVLHLRVMQFFAAAFGNALHKTISNFYKQKIAGKILTFDELYKIYLTYWRADNYLSEDHELEAKSKGKKMLKRFYEREKEKEAPKHIELNFKFRLEKDTIGGFIDAVFEDEEGKIRIIDFKSSNVDTADKAYQEAVNSRQLGIYALAYQKLYGRLPDSVGLYFLGTGIVGESKPTERRIERVKRDIQTAREGIVAENFDPKPSNFNCRWCAFSKICPYNET